MVEETIFANVRVLKVFIMVGHEEERDSGRYMKKIQVMYVNLKGERWLE